MGPIQTIEDFVDMLRRRAALMVAILVLGAAASVTFALYQPHLYLSSEVIQIERPLVSTELAPTTVQGSSARRLQLIEQKLMARDSILGLVEEFGVFANMPALTDLEKVELFRESVTFEGLAAAREGMSDDGTVSVLTITAKLGSPELAQDVVRELGARTIALSGEARRAKTQAALEFFRGEERALLEAIAKLENEMAKFRSQNQLAISGGIASSQEQIGAIETALIAAEQNRITVQNEIDQISATSQRPATQRRIEELNRQLASLGEQRAFLSTRRDQLRQSLNGAPEIERQVSVLQMSMEQYQEQLVGISAHRVDAEIGQQLEASRQAERLEVLEPASYSSFPVEPSRKKIAALGTMASLMAALGLALSLEMRNPVIRSPEQMQRELGFAPAIAIPFQKPRRRPRASRFPKLARWLRNPLRQSEAWGASMLSKIGTVRRAS